MNEVLGAIDILTDLPVDIGIHYGSIRTRLESAGATIGPNDLLIAAHARAADLTIVTGNDREFRRVPGLRVENWLAE
jgi:tRNA(fMet)-specific endonuclease VapC